MSVHRLVKFCFSASKICLATIMLGTALTSAPVNAGVISTTDQSSSLVGKRKTIAANNRIKAVERNTNTPKRSSFFAGKKKMVAANSNGRLIANGTFLYGESNQPGRLNSEYVVFENKSGRVFGAVFLANSEFSCFHGKLRSSQLNMMVVDTDSNAAHPYAVNLETGYKKTSSAEYKAVKKIGRTELRLLESCRSMYKSSRWQSVLRG
jgi:hypothetical protein